MSDSVPSYSTGPAPPSYHLNNDGGGGGATSNPNDNMDNNAVQHGIGLVLNRLDEAMIRLTQIEGRLGTMEDRVERIENRFDDVATKEDVRAAATKEDVRAAACNCAGNPPPLKREILAMPPVTGATTPSDTSKYEQKKYL